MVEVWRKELPPNWNKKVILFLSMNQFYCRFKWVCGVWTPINGNRGALKHFFHFYEVKSIVEL